MRNLWLVPVLLLLAVASTAWAEPAAKGLGMLVPSGAPPSTGESAARTLATDQHGAVAVAVEAGAPLALPEGLRALWWHCETWPLPAQPNSPDAIGTLRAWIEEGHGLFLSGTALAYVQALGLEPASPRVGASVGEDAVHAGVDPSAAPGHPIYAGFPPGQPIGLSSGGYNPFADFHASGGPSGGVVIGRASPDAGEQPLVEYALGKGRVIALGWRLTRYGCETNQERANLERLTGNITTYLASGAWYGDILDARQRAVLAELGGLDPVPIRRAIEDLRTTYGPRYPRAGEYLALVERLAALREAVLAGDESLLPEARELVGQARTVLLDNPLMDFDRLLLVRRGEGNLGLPQNWESNSTLARQGYDNEIAVLSPVGPEGTLATLYRPDSGEFVGDVDLHFAGDRMLFSMPRGGGPWRVWQIGADGTGLEPIQQVEEPDVDNYDACYLPNGNTLFTSTAPFVGVPCVTGGSHVANLFLLDEAAGGAIRQLTYEQDHDWCPTVMNDGRVLYQRWEYSDLPHFVSRILFSMNPDGSDQKAYYGSNSYWPNAMFYARPIPGDPTRFVAVVGGHHDNPRMGELVLFDSSQGQGEAGGAVQRIPGYGKRIEPIILDGLTQASWPKFLHPYPLSDKYFLVSCKPSPSQPWGIYLADVFDNLTLIKQVPGSALLEPLPFRPTPAPPAVPQRTRPGEAGALVYLSDVYAGPGLQGVPRGSVKRLRLFTYHFAYHGVGGQTCRVGFDGPWDIKRAIGTVPVEPDGSALFRVPANTPISLQPLDEDGQALQLMRSWFTAMPGETISCVGCHEPRGTAPPPGGAAATRAPAEIAPWYGPTRGFSFAREVQPVLNRYCISCHDGHAGAEGEVVMDLRDGPPVQMGAPDPGYNNNGWFTPSYLALKRWVRNATMESDMHLLMPGEFGADTTRLMRVLREGHHGVRLDPESWDRLTTWIDLNTPGHGTWGEIVGEDRVRDQRERRRAMMRLYANRDEDPEAIATEPSATPPPAAPVLAWTRPGTPSLEGWPLTPDEAAREQAALGEVERTVDLGDGVQLVLRRVPAGSFVMGDADDPQEGQAPRVVEIERPFWIGALEVTNEQFARFDPGHRSRLESGDFLQFGIAERGWPMDGPRQPVVRLSAEQADAFCRWLSERTGETCLLPTEEQWEYACRAGSASALSYGEVEAEFSRYANLADRQLRSEETHAPWVLPSAAIPEWRPAVATVDDGYRVTAPVGSYLPNAWGLYDMHGNAAEWTRSTWTPPGGPVATRLERIVRGGSWYDLPRFARAGHRGSYAPYRGVFDVGFRVVLEEHDG